MASTRWIVGAGIGVLVAWLFAQAANEPSAMRFEAYTLHAPISDAMEQVVRQLAGADGQVTVAPPYRLLVVATDANHRRIAEALQRLDRPPVNVRLTVRFSRANEGRVSETSVGGAGEISREEGLTRTKIRVKPRVQDETVNYSDQVAQTLVIASGRDGYIAVGKEIPYLGWIMEYGRQCGAVQAAFEWRSVGAYLVAQPQVVGEGPLIRVRLIPELRGLDTEGKPRAFRFTEVATEVVVRDGHSFSLGGWVQDAEFYSRFLVGRSRGRGLETLHIHLTADIVRP